MQIAWKYKKTSNRLTTLQLVARSCVLTCLGIEDRGDEWRTDLMFDTKTLVMRPNGEIEQAGPVIAGIRYEYEFLSSAPDPMQIVTLHQPCGVFHPNVSGSGAMCLGHPRAGFTIDSVVHQIWAALMFNMQVVNPRPGEVVNPAAAEYVRSTDPNRFPISRRGLFEEPDHDLRNKSWHVLAANSANHRQLSS